MHPSYRKLRYRQFKQVAHGHAADKWQKQDSKWGLLALEPTLNSAAFPTPIITILTTFSKPWNQLLKPSQARLLTAQKCTKNVSVPWNFIQHQKCPPSVFGLSKSYLFFKVKPNPTSSKQASPLLEILFPPPNCYASHSVSTPFRAWFGTIFVSKTYSFAQWIKFFEGQKIPLKIWILV